MRRILGIFRKDARHLCPQTLLFWAVLGAAAAIDPLPHGNSDSPVRMFLPFLQPLACWFLVVSAIHGEKLIGDEQYWLARPYSWKHLMAAKGLFLLVFVNLPVLVCQIATLAALGISPLDWLSALLWRQVFFTIAFVLPAAAVAAVTRNLGQVLLAGTFAYIVFAAGVSLSQLIQGRWPVWGAVDWIRDCGMALVAATGATAALALQYSQRKTALARAVLAGTAGLTILVMTAPRWGGAYAIQRLFSPERIRDSAVRISFDESRAGTHPLTYGTDGDDPQGARLEIPVRVRVDDLPEGTVVALDQVSFSLKSERATWRSGWLAFHALHDSPSGAAWLTVWVDPYFYQGSLDASVTLDGTADLTLGRPVRTRPVRFERALVPEFGICTFDGMARSPELSCFSPFQQVSVELVWATRAFPEFSGNGPYAPFPTSAGFRPLDTCLRLGMGAEENAGYSLAMTRPVAHVRRGFHMPGLRMRQFKMPQP